VYFSSIARLPGLNSADSTDPLLTSAIACDVVRFCASWVDFSSVWLASQTRTTITISGKNALRRNRFTSNLRSG
jgi:hypothetical protein